MPIAPDTPDGRFAPGYPLIGVRGTPITSSFLNSLLDEHGDVQEITVDVAIAPTSGTVFITTTDANETRIATLPALDLFTVYKRITIIHTYGSSGLATIPASDGLPQTDLAPGQGITIMARATAWEVIGRL